MPRCLAPMANVIPSQFSRLHEELWRPLRSVEFQYCFLACPLTGVTKDQNVCRDVVTIPEYNSPPKQHTYWVASQSTAAFSNPCFIDQGCTNLVLQHNWTFLLKKHTSTHLLTAMFRVWKVELPRNLFGLPHLNTLNSLIGVSLELWWSLAFNYNNC